MTMRRAKKSARALTFAASALLLSACASPERQQLALASADYADGVVIYELNAEQTTIRFEVMQDDRLVVGRFRAADARLTFSECRFVSPQIEVNIATDSVDIGNPLLDGVLRGRQWFDSGQFPLARFASREVDVGAGTAQVAGELTLRAVTQPVALMVTLAGNGLDTFPTQLAFDANTAFERSRFGMTTARSLVADEVAVKVSGVFELAVRNCP